jgi:uncharacterized membrane protein
VNTNRIPVWFARIAIIFGTVMVFLTPPFQVTDEFWHFFRAYEVSQGHFVAETQGNTQGGMLPFSLLRLANRFAKLPGHLAEKTSLKVILDAGKIPLDPGREVFCDFPSSANYSPVVYAPQAIAMAIGRWVGFNPLGLLYLGRGANLLAWTLAGYFTLRLVPALRSAVLILMLMPMTISLAASVSADGMTIALSLLFTALVWHCGTKGGINRRAKLAIIGLSIAVALCKFAYLPLMLLVLLIPPVRFGGKGRYVRFVAVLVIVDLLASVAWLSQSAGTKLVLRPDHPEVNVSRQLAFVREHPIAFPEAMVKGFAHDGVFIVRSFVGNLGWIDNPVSPVVVGLYLLALIAACVPMRGDPPSPEAWRLAIVAAVVCASVVTFAFLNYLVWTPVGYWYLQGLQGRYFIPLGLAMLILIWGITRRFLVRPDTWQINLLVIGFCVCGCIYTVFLVMGRYFGTG